MIRLLDVESLTSWANPSSREQLVVRKGGLPPLLPAISRSYSKTESNASSKLLFNRNWSFPGISEAAAL